MENTDKPTAMLSRSLRLRRETLDALKVEAQKRDIGITVYMRLALEALVENIQREEAEAIGLIEALVEL